MRFKIRTLFFLTMLAAILIAVVVRPYLAATSEAAALERLEKDWEILVDAKAFLGIEKSVTPLPHHWTHWPARKLFGDGKLTRIQKLRLVAPKTDHPSLEELAAFDFVTHLEFNQWLNRDVVLDVGEYVYVGQMTRLQDLAIGPSVSEGLVHLSDLPLNRLLCGGPNWSQAQFDAIGAIQSLKRIQLRTNRFDSEYLAALGNLSNVQQFVLTTGYNDGTASGEILGLKNLADISSLRHVTLFGQLGSDEFKALAMMKNLESLHLQGDEWSAVDVLQLKRSKNLKYTTFGHLEISIETYDALTAAGIAVEHDGLTGAELEKEYFVYRRIYFPFDSKKSEMNIWCTADSETFTVTLNAVAGPKPRHDWSALSPPALEFYGFTYSNDWSELAGFKTKVATSWGDWDDESGNFYDGIHQRTNNHEIEFVSRDDNQFRIKWSCLIGDYEKDAIPCEIDASIRLRRVFVSNHNQPLSIDAAKQVIRKHFEPEDFEQPEHYDRQKTIAVFKLKEGRKKPE